LLLDNKLLTLARIYKRNLVLDYLCHNCYSATARAFARDSAVRHLDADGDEIMGPEKGSSDATDLTGMMLRLVDLRQRQPLFLVPISRKRLNVSLEIRIHILSGRVDDATSLLNMHFPLVLDETGSYTPEPPSPSTSTSEQVEYIALTSVDPTHLSLNLRILAFIEASRTIPLAYVPHSQESSGEPTPSEKSKSQSPIYELDDTVAKQTELLCRAQKLYSAANSLQNPSDRATYLKELGNVGGLLAYKHPEDSPMAKYLSQERREAVANQINSAILCTFVHSGHF
jgi:hypothetical protein